MEKKNNKVPTAVDQANQRKFLAQKRSNLKHYKRLRRLDKLCTDIIGTKAWKLFDKVSEFKKTLKKDSVKLLRKTLLLPSKALPKASRNAIKSAWKGSKFFVLSIFKYKMNIYQVVFVKH